MLRQQVHHPLPILGGLEERAGLLAEREELVMKRDDAEAMLSAPGLQRLPQPVFLARRQASRRRIEEDQKQVGPRRVRDRSVAGRIVRARDEQVRDLGGAQPRPDRTETREGGARVAAERHREIRRHSPQIPREIPRVRGLAVRPRHRR